MENLRDYPAAHSMDTTWFAVDRDGHIAVFDSGEAGAVPRDAYEEGATVDALLPALPASEAVYVLEGHLEAGRDNHVPHGHTSGTILVFLDELGAAAEDVSAGRAREV